MSTSDRLTVVLVHGFMDDSAIWSATRSQLTADGMKALPLAPVEHQRAARLGLSAHFLADELDRLIAAGGAVPPSTVSDVLDVWNEGTSQGRQPSEFAGPVLILPGAADPFATAELIAGGVSSRFTDVQVLPVPEAGHWPHVEAPAFVAAHLDAFIASRMGEG